MARKKRAAKKKTARKAPSKKKAVKTKKAASKKSTKKETLYVGIADPVDVRRQILEASKDIIQMMQQFERYREVRRERKEAILTLRSDLHEVRGAITRLKKVLPKVKHKKEKPKPVKVVPEPVMIEQPKPAPKPKKRVAKTEVDKLELELDEIERKLEHLS